MNVRCSSRIILTDLKFWKANHGSIHEESKYKRPIKIYGERIQNARENIKHHSCSR